MIYKLPPRPNIRHLKSQAKRLIKQFRAGEKWAFEEFKEFHPTFRGKALLNISLSEMHLSDAQLVIARSYGFSGWEPMSRHVANVRGDEVTGAERQFTLTLPSPGGRGQCAQYRAKR